VREYTSAVADKCVYPFTDSFFGCGPEFSGDNGFVTLGPLSAT
jgi:hypothetical protein